MISDLPRTWATLSMQARSHLTISFVWLQAYMPMRLPILSGCFPEDKPMTQARALHSPWPGRFSLPKTLLFYLSFSTILWVSDCPVSIYRCLSLHVCCCQPLPPEDVGSFQAPAFFPPAISISSCPVAPLFPTPASSTLCLAVHPHPPAMEILLLSSAKVPAANGQPVDQISVTAETKRHV